MSRKKKYATDEERKAARAAKNKRYREKHKAEIAAKQRQWYQDNRTTISEQHKQYRTEHKAEIATRMKRYNAEYYSTPFGRAANLASRYRQNDRENDRGECTIDADWIVKNVFSGQVCHYCGESDWTKLGVDRKDSSLPHTPENCVPCCDCCNKKKYTTSYEEFIDKIQREAS